MRDFINKAVGSESFRIRVASELPWNYLSVRFAWGDIYSELVGEKKSKGGLLWSPKCVVDFLRR